MRCTIPERVAELAAEYGSLSRASTELEIDASYMSRLMAGKKRNPSDEVLRKLGLRRVVVYEREEP